MRLYPAYLFVLLFAIAGCDAEGLSGNGSDESSADLVVVNRSSVTIDGVYIAPCQSTSWGENRLSANGISPSYKQTFDVETGCNSVLITSEDANGVRFSEIDFTTAVTLDITSLILTNKSSEVITGLFLTECGGANAWGDDWLDGDLAVGHQYVQLIHTGCRRMRAETASGATFNTLDVTIEETYRWVLE